MDVLGPRVVLRVVGQVDRRFVVQVEGARIVIVFAELVEEGSQVSSLFGSLGGGCDNFSFTGGQCDGGLLLAAPCDSSLAVHEDVTRGGVPGGPV
eukprot:6187308-Pleurochrysis_carterae.AAC.1